MMNGTNHRYVTEADAYDPQKAGHKQTLTLSMWPDGSGNAKIDGHELKNFVKFIDNTPHGRLRVIRMLREAADLIEQDVL